jgi:hypothetical protein
MKHAVSVLIVGLLCAVPAWGQWGDVGSFLTNSPAKASSSFIQPQVDATLNSGNVGVCVLATDNIGTASGDNDDHTSVTDSDGNTWTQRAEMTNAGNANASCTVSVWTTVAGADLAAPDTIRFNFASAVTAKSVECREFTKGAGNVVSVVGTTTTDEANNTDVQSLASASVSSGSYLFFRGICWEGDADTTGMTATTDFTSCGYTSTDGGGESGNMGVSCEYRIVTSTQQTSDPTMTGDAGADNASGFPILKEAAAPTTKTQAIVIGDN